MSRVIIILLDAEDRALACRWIAKAPVGMRVEFKAAKRSIPQNDRMWAMLTNLSVQLRWHGQMLRPEDWKLVTLDALHRELRIVPNIAGNGFVSLGRSSSDLSKDEMSQLIELIAAFGTEHGVVFHDPTMAPEREKVDA